MDRGVAFPGPGRPAASARVLPRRWPGRLGGDAGACFWRARIGGVRSGFRQVSAAGDDGLLDRAAQGLPQVEAVGHLNRVRRSLAGAFTASLTASTVGRRGAAALRSTCILLGGGAGDDRTA